MQDDKLIKLFDFYSRCARPVQLHENEYKRRVALDAIYTNRDGYSRSMNELAREHAAWMALEAKKFIEEARQLERDAIDSDSPFSAPVQKAQSKREKAHRWLGFIQGVLWMAGVFTLDELKEHSHQCSADYEKEKG